MATVRFVSPLVVERIEGSRWRLAADFVCEVNGAQVVVPSGFVTDFASVPRLPLAYYLAGGRGVKAATLHDWLYATKGGPREWCDAVFRAGLIAEGEPELLADAMYAAVRAGGGSHFDAGEVLNVEFPEQPAG